MLHIFFFVLLLTGILYILMILFFSMGWYMNRRPAEGINAFRTKVSVIIPARNEESNLPDLLNDLFLQDFPKNLMEVIVADDGSTDGTAASVRKFAGDHPGFPLILVPTSDKGFPAGSKKKAVKAAISLSSGKLILGTDADVRVDPGWITSMVRLFEETEPQMILGPVIYSDNGTVFGKIQACEFLGLMAVTDCSCNLRVPVMCNGANIAYTREAFDRVNGFDDNEHMPSGDDMFLMMKVRREYGPQSVRFNRVPEATVATEPSRTIGDFLYQRLRWVSKSRGYKDSFVIVTAIVTYLFNLLLAAGFFVGFFFPSFLIPVLLLLAAKIVAEFPLLWKYAGFTQRRGILVLVPLVQVLNIFYVTLIGFLGNFLPYQWKGRSVSPEKRR